MSSPNSSTTTSTFNLSGNPLVDPLLNENYEKWGSALGTGAALLFSFPWINGLSAYWQAPFYSSANEPSASIHAGLNTTQMAAARNALQAWANVANLTFTETSETNTNVGDFRFAFSSAIPSTTWGLAYYPSNYWASAADVWINPTHRNDTNWSSGSYDYEALLHEIGHGLGLKHPGNYDTDGSGTPGPYLPASLDYRNYTIMSYNNPVNSLFVSITNNGNSYSWTSYNVIPDTPMLYDLAAIQYLYGANTTYHSGNDTYTFDPNTPFYRTIWDAGGTDAISVSNFTKACTIDLNAGHISKITIESDTSPSGVNWPTPPPTKNLYDGSDNLAIAFGVTIENAIGGSGNDTLVGNITNNNLSGGVGNDTINAGDGNDTISGGAGNDVIDGGDATDVVLFSGVRASYTINYTSGIFTVTSFADGTDTLSNVENASFTDQTVSLATLADTVPPIVSIFYPSNGGTGVAISANIILTFSEAIQRGTGNILLKTISDTVVATYDAATSSNLSISGNTLTIDPTSGLSYSTGYKVEFASGTIKDLAGNSYAGITTYNFTTLAQPTYALTANSNSVNEGSSITYTLTTTGVAAGTVFSYDLSGITTADVVGGSLNGIFTLDTGGVATFTVSLVADNLTEGAETMVAKVSNIPSVTLATATGIGVNDTSVTPLGSSHSKVFLSSAPTEAITVANSGITIYGDAGRDVISLNAGAHNIILDQNIDRVNLQGAASNFTFKQLGNQLAVYDDQGSTMILTMPVQGDADGTQIGFNNGSIYDAKLSAAVLSLGGTTLSYSSPSVVFPATQTSTVEPFASATSTARIFMGNNDIFTVANNGVKVYGGSGMEVVTITDGIHGIIFDQNIEELIFGGSRSNYRFQQTGNLINIYNFDGTTLLAKGPVQGDADGTLLTFSNGTNSALIVNGGVMQLGVAAISTGNPAVIY